MMGRSRELELRRRRTRAGGILGAATAILAAALVLFFSPAAGAQDCIINGEVVPCPPPASTSPPPPQTTAAPPPTTAAPPPQTTAAPAPTTAAPRPATTAAPRRSATTSPRRSVTTRATARFTPTTVRLAAPEPPPPPAPAPAAAAPPAASPTTAASAVRRGATILDISPLADRQAPIRPAPVAEVEVEPRSQPASSDANGLSAALLVGAGGALALVAVFGGTQRRRRKSEVDPLDVVDQLSPFATLHD